MNSVLVIDASFLVKLFVPEDDSVVAATHWRAWLEEERPVLAPTLLTYEVTSAIRKKVQRRLMDAETGREALQLFLRVLPSVALVPAEELHEAAWALAEQYGRPNTYDAYYVALANLLECELWSADQRLMRAMPGEQRIRALNVEAGAAS